ncbi:MAG: hypothetical protein EHM40_13095 [Chloroflexi bacterium]|nr:MAG: hypothetical protein EHM40_13095 [Chloroflexota bacterium]
MRCTYLRNRHAPQFTAPPIVARPGTKAGTIFCFSRGERLLEGGCEIKTVQALLDHKDVKTTMLYTHVLQHESDRNDIAGPGRILRDGIITPGPAITICTTSGAGH